MIDLHKGLETLAKYAAQPATLEGVVFGNRFICAVSMLEKGEEKDQFMSSAALSHYLDTYDDIMEELDDQPFDEEFRAEFDSIEERLIEEGVL